MPDIRTSISPNKEFDKNELRERLTPTQYQVTQEHQTERYLGKLIYDTYIRNNIAHQMTNAMVAFRKLKLKQFSFP